MEGGVREALTASIRHMLMAKLGPQSEVVNRAGRGARWCSGQGIGFSRRRRKSPFVQLGFALLTWRIWAAALTHDRCYRVSCPGAGEGAVEVTRGEPAYFSMTLNALMPDP